MVNGGAQLSLTWQIESGAIEYDLEWTTADQGNASFSLIQQLAGTSPGNPDNAQLDQIFRNNASRVTLPAATSTYHSLSRRHPPTFTCWHESDRYRMIKLPAFA